MNKSKSKSKQDKATPRPWHLSHQLGDGFSIAREIAPNCGKLICVATAHNVGGWYDGKLTDEIAEANGRLIVRAVNEHIALLAVVETVPRLLGVIRQLMPGIGKIACEDYAEINDAPIAATKTLATLDAVRKGQE